MKARRAGFATAGQGRAVRVALAVAAGASALAAVPAIGRERAEAARSRSVTVRVGDYFFKPTALRVGSGTTIVWKWPSTPGDVHDVYLSRGPRGVKRFHSQLAASDYTYKRRLTVRGTYTVVCTLHPQMKMKITVR
ncbi:cupredoxin domain-containing protein [Thermoleophilum album]|uniref:Plastocyanin n=1 Tax=Thermoleophilum album TaxID=29539 RepID=A0A1H6FXM5_THEAL|nr:plastocyanin/azurin family copper-binding protein [Thermoleophilum album]SEH15547.1 Plastocyanin [Thermoleophilum album]